MEIQRILHRYGATQFGFSTKHGAAVIAFELNKRCVRFELPLPVEQEFTQTASGRTRNAPGKIKAACAGEAKRRWRALALVIKAKLEAVASGIVSFDVEFMPFLVLGDGQTVGTVLAPQLTRALAAGPSSGAQSSSFVLLPART